MTFQAASRFSYEITRILFDELRKNVKFIQQKMVAIKPKIFCYAEAIVIQSHFPAINS